MGKEDGILGYLLAGNSGSACYFSWIVIMVHELLYEISKFEPGKKALLTKWKPAREHNGMSLIIHNIALIQYLITICTDIQTE